MQTLHKEKLQACLAAVEVGPSSIQRLVDAEMTPARGMSAQFANMTPSSARKITDGPPSVTPTPMPGAHSSPVVVPSAAQLTPAPEDRGRAMGWKLVVVGAVALLAVAIAIALPNEPTDPIAAAPSGEPIAAGPGAVIAPAAGTPGTGAVEPTTSPVVVEPTAAAADTTATAAAADTTAAAAMPDTTAEPAGDAPTDREPERTRGQHTKRRSQRPDPASRTAAAETNTQPEPTTAEAPASATEQSTGFLSLVTSPWTTVILAGEELGTTPLVRRSLPVGRHVLRLVNDEAGISEQYAVEIRPGETTTRRLGLR